MTACESWLHRLEPRAKLVGLLAIVVSVFCLTKVGDLLALAGVLSVVLWWAGGLERLGRRIVLTAIGGYPATFILFAVALWHPARAAWPNLAESARASGVFTLRIVDIVLANVLLMLTTDPREFARSLRGWYLPAEICLILMTVLRFLPLAGQQARRILEAQRCRGYRLRRLWRPSAWLPLCLPLMVATLHRAEALAISLELRGFTTGVHALAPPRGWRWPDYAAAAGCALACAAVVLLG